jgi:uncharacterized damage-inducible protein DinB
MTGKVLAFQFEMNGRSMELNLDGVSHEDSLHRPARGGNCANWVVGHIVANRNSVHKMLGLGPAWDSGTDLYDRESAPLTDWARAEPLDAMLERFRDSQTAVTGAFETMEDSRLAAADDEDKPLGLRLAFLVFHESYHVGQLGLLRRLLGRDRAI